MDRAFSIYGPYLATTIPWVAVGLFISLWGLIMKYTDTGPILFHTLLAFLVALVVLGWW